MPRKILIFVLLVILAVNLSGGVVMSSALSTISTSAENLNMIPNPKWTLESFEKGERDYKENKALNAMVNLSLLADWYLTSRGIKDGGTELNPILGTRPTQEQIGLYFLSVLLGNNLLPKIIGSDYADIMRSHLLAAEIPCLESWLNPDYVQEDTASWKLTIPFKF